ncbi:MAG: TetR family transcriptional regulator C-terminal domain-containing protein [Bryobacteraceae bacterium]
MGKGEQTREMILLRAARLFNEKGYYGASLADVMEATGLQKGGLYNHFESKEQLALEAFDYAIERAGQKFTDALEGKRNAADRLVAIVSVFRRYVDSPPVGGGCPIMNTAIESDDANPALRDRARQAMERWRQMLRRIVTKGLERKELKPGTDPDRVATLLISALEGGIMLGKLYRNQAHLDWVADFLTKYIDKELRA